MDNFTTQQLRKELETRDIEENRKLPTHDDTLKPLQKYHLSKMFIEIKRAVEYIMMNGYGIINNKDWKFDKELIDAKYEMKLQVELYRKALKQMKNFEGYKIIYRIYNAEIEGKIEYRGQLYVILDPDYRKKKICKKKIK